MCDQPEEGDDEDPDSCKKDQESDNAVALTTGHKIERAVDVVVPLVGRDFVLSREYSSDPDLFTGSTGLPGGNGEVGNNWSLSTTVRLQVPQGGIVDNDAYLVGVPLRSVKRFRSGSQEGEGKGYLTTATISGDACYAYVLPDGSAQYFYADYDSDPNTSTTGRLRREIDSYGNQWNYHWDVLPLNISGNLKRPRLTRIYLNGDSSASEAEIELDWHYYDGPSAPDSFLRSRLKEVRVKRGTETVQTVTYHYANETGYPTSELGTQASLVEVVSSVPVYESGASSLTTRDRVTQYRYASFIDGTMAIGTAEDQLTAVFYPDDIEYYADEHGRIRSGGPYTSVLDAAADLRNMPLETPNDGSEANFPSGFPLPRVYSLASKLINYDEETDQVKDQYLSGGSCGCSGTAALGVKLSYEYFRYWWSLDNIAPGENPLRRGHTTKITEHAATTSGGYGVVRRRIYDYIDYTLPMNGASPPLDQHGALYKLAEATSNQEGGTNWYWATVYERRAAAGSGTAGGNSQIYKHLALQSTPESSEYTEWDDDPLPVRPQSDIAIRTSGLVYSYDQQPDGSGNPRVAELLVQSGANGTGTVIQASQYNDSTRPDLLTQEQMPATDSTKTTDFTYGYLSGAVAWQKASVTPDTQAQNGPGGSTVDTYTLFDARGQLRWVRHADGTLEYREYDAVTGQVTKIRENATGTEGTGTIAELNTTNFPGLTGVGSWANSGAVPMETTFTYDLLGRLTSTSLPSGASSYVRHEMRACEIAEGSTTPSSPDYRGVPFYAEVRLPYQLLDDSFNGPASIEWMDAADRPLQGSQFTLSTSGSYAPLADDGTTTPYVLDAEQSRSTSDLSHAGVVNVARQWHTMPATPTNCYETAYSYDGLGRVTKVVDPEGGAVWYGDPNSSNSGYDLLDRLRSVYVGVDASPTTAAKVAEYYYDDQLPDSPGGLYVGNGNLTLERRFTGKTISASPVTRDTHRWYDFRDRLVAVQNPEAPHQSFEYDNQDRVVRQASWTTDAEFTVTVTDPDHTATPTTAGAYPTPTGGTLTNRTTLSEHGYSNRGFNYRQAVAITPTSGSTGFLETHRWFDSRGRVIADWAPNQPTRKYEYDALSRPAKIRLTDRNADASPGATGNYADAASISNDAVLEQMEFRYTQSGGLDTGLLDLTSIWMRWHDIADSVQGTLDNSNSLVTHRGTGFDDAGREVASYWFGANGGSNGYFASGMSVPAPASYGSTASLKSETEYDAWGRVSATVSPEGTRTEYKLDPLSRQVAVIEAADAVDADDVTWTGSDWTVSTSLLSDDKDRVTTFAYDGLGNAVRRTAHTKTVPQTTEYVYGTSAGSQSNPLDSLAASSTLLQEVRYPNESTGQPGSTAEYKVQYAYNALGELRGMKDQNGTVHTFDRDDLGRVLHDRVPTFGTDVDNTVKRLTRVYDSSGRVQKVLSYTHEDPTQGTILNGVQFSYSSLHRLTQVKQNNDGDPASGGLTTEYVYADQAPIAQASPDFDSRNYSRLTGIKYPGQSSNTVTLAYDQGVDDRISRLSSMEAAGVSGAEDLVQYEYLGTSLFANTKLPAAKDSSSSTPSLDLDRSLEENGDSAQGVYPGFDSYGRVRFHAWARADIAKNVSTGLPTKTPLIARRYDYDADSNRVRDFDARPGILPADRDWRYLYDDLDRLSEAVRGQYSPSTGPHDMDVQAGSQLWNLDALGNWSEFTVDTDDADTIVYTDDPLETRAHNEANEIGLTEIEPPGDVPVVIGSPQHDANGNYRSNWSSSQVGRLKYTYDAWNRLVRVEVWATSTPVGEYEYNGLHWRVERKADISQGAYDGLDEHRHYYYSPAWQVLEEHVDESPTDSFAAVRKTRQFWGARYIDDAVARDVDWDGDDDWSDARHFFYLTDALFSVRALTDAEGQVVERIDYTPYGEAMHRFAQDLDESGAFGVDDVDVFSASFTSTGPGDPDYDPDVDFDGTGFNVDDVDHFNEMTTHAAPPLPEGWVADSTDQYYADNSISFAGYRLNQETGHHDVRHRVYYKGRWLQRDPVGYIDGSNLYAYARSNPRYDSDPFGLSPTIDKLRESAQKAYGCLSNRDQDRFDLFYNTQDCILQNLSKCAAACGDDLKDEVSEWLDSVTTDFMTPFTNSMSERCSGMPATDPGWNAFFDDVDNNRLDGQWWVPWGFGIMRKTAASITEDLVDGGLYGGGSSLFRRLDEDDFLVLGGHRFAHAMAINHINNDLRNALMNNGVGYDEVWDCIGDVVADCQKKSTNLIEQIGNGAGSRHVPNLDVQAVRDRMREEVRRELDNR